jgi:O-antigen/teichoic acid export membrane protein
MSLLESKFIAMQTTWTLFRANGILQSIGILVGGTGLAGVISAAALPVLTRLYTPADFSVLAVFTGLIAIVSVAACLRFDIAIAMPEHDDDAVNVLCLALFCAAVISILLGIVLLVSHAQLVAWIRQPDLEPYLWLVPIGVFLAAGNSALTFWVIRRKNFTAMARTRIAQASAAAGVQGGFGWWGSSSLGLILGPLVSTGLGFIGLGYRMVRTDGQLLGLVAWPKMRSVFITYRGYPKYSALEALSNSAGMQLPIILIAALAAGPEAGFLLLALSIIQAPMGLLGNAIAQVYLSRAPEEFRRDHLGAFTSKIFGGLFKSGLGPLAFAGILAPVLFAKVFGPEWHRAGVLLAWMTPWCMMQFVATPVSMGLLVSNHQKAALLLQLFGLLLRTASVYGASIAGGAVSEAYALSGFVFYLVYLVFILVAVRARPADLVREMRNGFPALLLWILAGLVCLGGLSALRL